MATHVVLDLRAPLLGEANERVWRLWEASCLGEKLINQHEHLGEWPVGADCYATTDKPINSGNLKDEKLKTALRWQASAREGLDAF
jgi:hypothetical protein